MLYHQDHQIHVVVQTIIIDIMCHQQLQIVKQPHKHQINYLHLMGSIARREQKVRDQTKQAKNSNITKFFYALRYWFF